MADNEGKGETSALVVGEVVEAIRQQDKAGSINVNILIQQVSEKAHDPAEIILQTEKALELAGKWEQRRLEAFKARVDAVIDAKLRDPDEVEKRQNNGVRRTLKRLIGVLAVLTVLGGIAGALMGGPIIVVMLLLLVGAVGIAMLGPLASGESVSAADVAQILQAAGSLVPGRQQQNQNQGGKKKR